MACEGLNFDLCRLFVSVSIHQNLKNTEDYSEDVFVAHTVFNLDTRRESFYS